MASGDLVTQLRERGRGDVRSHEIELVLLSVVGAMADQYQDEVIIRVGLIRDRLEGLRQMRARSGVA